MGNINLTNDDLISVNMNVIHSLVYEANSTPLEEKEEKIKKLVLAKRAIDKTLSMMGYFGS